MKRRYVFARVLAWAVVDMLRHPRGDYDAKSRGPEYRRGFSDGVLRRRSESG